MEDSQETALQSAPSIVVHQAEDAPTCKDSHDTSTSSSAICDEILGFNPGAETNKNFVHNSSHDDLDNNEQNTRSTENHKMKDENGNSGETSSLKALDHPGGHIETSDSVHEQNSTSSGDESDSNWSNEQEVSQQPDTDLLALNESSQYAASQDLLTPTVKPILAPSTLGQTEAEDVNDITDYGERIYARDGPTNFQRDIATGLPTKRKRRRKRKSLQRRLFSALQVDHHGKREFFPKTSIKSLITEECVFEELGDDKYLGNIHSEEVIRKYAKKVCEETEFLDESNKSRTRCFRKIFMILVLIDKTKAIVKFLEREPKDSVNDSDLPLAKVERTDERGAYDLRLSRHPSRQLKCFSRDWSQLNIRNFEEYQWATLSPFFGKPGHKDVKHYRLKDRAILPFLPVRQEDESCRAGEYHGGFAKVFQVDIHPDHHNFGDVDGETKSEGFAVKCLHSPDRIQFMNEVDMLKKFSNPTHKHLISLLATYEQSKSFFLIFHWAEADLQRYWREINPTPSFDKETVLWVAEQCKGIAEGVMKIHQYTSSSLHPQTESYGHHGDIKPQNVLWFPQPGDTKTRRGTLKLSDFGLAGLSKNRTHSMKAKSVFATSPPYRAPEVDIEGTVAIGRSYDMWTLGCLYLEFITWMLGGWDKVDQFEFDRDEGRSGIGQEAKTFFKLVRGCNNAGEVVFEAKIKPVVTDLINELYDNQLCKFVREFLDMIRNDLLIVETRDGEIRERPSSQQVFAALTKMFRDCIQDFACDPAPGPSTMGETADGSNDASSQIEKVVRDASNAMNASTELVSIIRADIELKTDPVASSPDTGL